MVELLNKIKNPQELKNFTNEERTMLCRELRGEIISATSKNGGHLASNLGVVELTVALLSTFNVPEDTIIWDVGHQCYSYKLLTGRFKDFNTIRTQGGLTGFPDRAESEYDTFTTGHSSASVSSAYGVHRANLLNSSSAHTVAIIGDGALTGGLAYEALNNIGRHRKNFIIILNDNNMSISKNVGSVSKHLAHIRANEKYVKLKYNVDSFLSKLPIVGSKLSRLAKYTKRIARKAFLDTTIFENMGFVYYGPYDGHDMEALMSALDTAKKVSKPVIVHLRTTKGKGYQHAENQPKEYHGVSKFDMETGEVSLGKKSFSAVLGSTLSNIALLNTKVCAVTAAMGDGTGLKDFASVYKNRFFDVGIAEAHAVTFSAGLAAKGYIPVFAVYSTFLQRAFDSIVHDVALQNLKVILAIDRAGLVGEDGKTHQGLFDVSMFKAIPNVTVFSPSYFDELDFTIQKAIEGDYKLVAIRYPRGHEGFKPINFSSSVDDYDVYGDEKADTCVVCYGRIFSEAVQLVTENKDNIKVIKLNRIIPISDEAVTIASECKNVLFVEEATAGIAETFGIKLYKKSFKGNFKISDIKNPFVEHAPMQEQLKALGLDKDGIHKSINRYFKGG